MEKVKEKNNHIFRYIAIALYVVAAILIIAGMVTMFSGAGKNSNNTLSISINSNIYNSPGNVFDDDFFDDFESEFGNGFNNNFKDEYNQKSKSMFKSFALIASGCFLIFVASIFLFIDMHKNRTFQKMGKSMIDGLMDTMAYTKTSFEEKVLNKDKSEPYYCEFCGGMMAESDTKCQSCGATRRQKD